MADNDPWKARQDRVQTLLDADEATHLIAWRGLVLLHPHWPRTLPELDRLELAMKKKEKG